MGYVGQEGPEGTHHGGAHGLSGNGQVVHEAPPAQLGFVADGAHQVVLGTGDPGHVDARRRPDDLANVVLVEAHVGSGHREIKEVFGFDSRHVLGLEMVPDVAGGRGTGLPGVVPALEGSDQDRGSQVSRHLVDVPDEVRGVIRGHRFGG